MNLQGSGSEWYYKPTAGATDVMGSGVSLQGSSPSLGGSAGTALQNGGQLAVQPTANPTNYSQADGGNVLGVRMADTSIGGGAAAPAGGGVDQAAADAARATQLRGATSQIINQIKNIFDARYGRIDTNAGEQVGKLNDRFGTESADLTRQITDENQKIGAASAAAGTFDSSYRGNNVDTVTNAGEQQIGKLGSELESNIAAIAQWVTSQKTATDAEKSGVQKIQDRLGETTDVGELTSLRDSIDAQLTSLRAQGADLNTTAQNASALETVAPTAQRAQTLQTTLSQILAGNADQGTKNAIGGKLIEASNLTPEEKQRIQQWYAGNVGATTQEETEKA